MPCYKNRGSKEQYKICSVCRIEKEATGENFKVAKTGLYGLAARCKECDKIYRTENKIRDHEAYRIYYIQKKKEMITYNQSQRAKRYNLDANLTVNEWVECIEYFKCRCAYCGKYTTKLHQDHVVPVSKGGPYNRYNIVPACRNCNTNKNAQDLIEWYQRQKFFDSDRLLKILVYLRLI